MTKKRTLISAVLIFTALFFSCSTEPTSGLVDITDIQPTIYFKKPGGELMQAANMTLRNNTDLVMNLVLKTELPFTSRTQLLGIIRSGEEKAFEVYIPPLPDVTGSDISFALYREGEVRTLLGRKSMKWKYQRQWKVYLAPYSHMDVGFTTTQEKVRLKQMNNIDVAMALVDKTESDPSYGPGSRFRYTCEASWMAEEYLRDRPEDRKKKFIDMVNSGKMEVLGFIDGHHDKVIEPEALIRSTYFAANEMRRLHGFKITGAVMHDVVDASSIVQPLARAGIRYFQFGPNTARFGLPPLIRLSAPSMDGTSILFWTPAIGGYGEGIDLSIRPPMPPSPDTPHDPNAPVYFEVYEPKIRKHLEYLQTVGIPTETPSNQFDHRGFKTKYPYDAYLATYYPAHDGDNGVQDITPSDVARDWNSKFEYPKMLVATFSEFFKYVEANFDGDIPAVRGDFSGFWGEQAFYDALQPNPARNTKNRDFSRNMRIGEAISAYRAREDASYAPPPTAVREAYLKFLLNDDHNPGPTDLASGHTSTEGEKLEWKQVNKEWGDFYSGFSRDFSREGLEYLSTLKVTPAPLSPTYALVYNSMSWARSDVVEIEIDVPMDAVDVETGLVSLSQSALTPTGSTTLRFMAGNVPAMGTKVFKLVPEGSAGPKPGATVVSGASAGVLALENEYYLVSVGAGDGMVKSVYDKELNRELVSTNDKYGFNQVVILQRSQSGFYGGNPFGADNKNLSNDPALISPYASPGETGPLCSSVIITGAPMADITPVQEIRLCSGIKRVEFIQTFPNCPFQNREWAVAYPLDVRGFKTFKVEEPFNPIEIGVADPYHLYPDARRGDSFAALKMVGSFRNNTFTMAFEWLQGIPASYVFKNWLDISRDDFGVSFSSLDSGAILPGGYEPDVWRGPSKSTFYQICIGSTVWGEMALGIQANETYRFRSALMSHPGKWNSSWKGKDGTESVARFGYGFTNPMVASLVTGALNTGVPSSASLASVDVDNVLIHAVKREEGGAGTVVRLLETGLKPVTAAVTIHLAGGIRNAYLASSVEEKQFRLPVSEDGTTFSVCMSPGMLATVLLSDDTEDLPDYPCAPPPADDLKTYGCSCNSGGRDPGAGELATLLLLALPYLILRRQTGRRAQ